MGIYLFRLAGMVYSKPSVFMRMAAILDFNFLEITFYQVSGMDNGSASSIWANVAHFRPYHFILLLIMRIQTVFGSPLTRIERDV